MLLSPRLHKKITLVRLLSFLLFDTVFFPSFYKLISNLVFFCDSAIKAWLA